MHVYLNVFYIGKILSIFLSFFLLYVPFNAPKISLFPSVLSLGFFLHAQSIPPTGSHSKIYIRCSHVNIGVSVFFYHCTYYMILNLFEWFSFIPNHKNHKAFKNAF